LNHTLKLCAYCTTKSKGDQPGNKNAVGNDGRAPGKNKNAVKTGEFETLFFDALEDDEKQLINMIQLLTGTGLKKAN
jgi:uncharacterized protein YjcR